MSARPLRITDPRAVPQGWSATVRAYVELTKPRIIELLLVTTLPAMIVAAGGWPGTGLAIATLAGGALSAGGANTINQVADRDIDAIMRRTRSRPLPTGRVSPQAALVFGVLLGLAGFAVLWTTSNLLAASLSTAGLLFYVFVYTLVLKRSTPQNIVIGGAAGAVPALVGWAAVTGSLSLAPWVMFAVVFLWTPPHFWALALRYREDYEVAGVPMLPATAGEGVALMQIVRYTVMLVAVSLVLFSISGVGVLYVAAAAVLGSGLLVSAVRLRRRSETAMAFFGASNVYLAALFTLMALDVYAGDGGELRALRTSALVLASLLIVPAAVLSARSELRPGPGRRATRLIEVLLPTAGIAALLAVAWALL
ncbi:MAG: heme o synthase [Acidimicrobiia bacterium]